MTEFLNALHAVKSWFAFLLKRGDVRRENERRAVKALYLAVNETVLYFRRLSRPRLARFTKDARPFERDIEREEQLSRLWMDAAAELRDVDRELADRCFLKGHYWADREAWTEEQIKAADIQLGKILRDAQELVRH